MKIQHTLPLPDYGGVFTVIFFHFEVHVPPPWFTTEKSFLMHESSLQIGNVSLLWASNGQRTTTLLLKKILPKLRPNLSTVHFGAIGTENSHLAFIAYFRAIKSQVLFHNSIKHDLCDPFIIHQGIINLYLFQISTSFQG